MPILYGVSPSPYVRKVMVVLAEKQIAYDSVPMSPATIDDAYRAKSPLGKIPCWEDGDYALADSSCIIAYLEKAHPTPAIYPSEPKDLGRALWFEEYADTKLWRDCLMPAFFERLVKPKFFGEEPDEAAIALALSEEAPAVFDYLEAQLGDREWLVGESFSVADVAVGSPFVCFHYGGESVDAARWPKLAAYVKRVLDRDSFKACMAADQAMFSASEAS